MDIWEKLCQAAQAEYRPEELSPFIYAHHVVAAIEAEDGRIFTGFCIESASGVLNLCAERVAAVNMLSAGGGTFIRRIVAFRDTVPSSDVDVCNFLPCGACLDFFMQLDHRNKQTEILTDLASRKTVTVSELLPHFWGEERYKGGKI